MATLALYERILALVKPQELHRSCNDILQEEYTALQKVVDDVAAAFAKVEEVRDAVKQLEHGKPSAGRSESLMETMHSTMKLQKELKKRLEEVATDMKVQTERAAAEEEKGKSAKRKRGEEAIQESSSSSEEEEMEDKKPKRAKPDEQKETVSGAASDRKESADLHLAHVALKTIRSVRTVNKQIQFDTRDKWPEALFDVKRILKRQATRDARTTDKPAAEVAALALEAAVAVFKRVGWTTENVTEVRSVIAALTDACSKNETLRVYFHRVRAQLESLEMSIPAEKKTPKNSRNAKPESSGGSLGLQLRTYRNLISAIRTEPTSSKPKRIVAALQAMQQFMTDDFMSVYQYEIHDSVDDMKRLIGDVPLHDHLAKECFSFANAVIAYGKRFPGKQKQTEWQRLANSLFKLVDEKGKPSQQQTTPMVSKKTEEVQGRLASALSHVEQWQDGIFSLDQLDKLLKVMNEVVSYKSKNWNPMTDSTTRTCVEKLVSCIQLIKKQAHRDKRLKTVKKWQRSIDNWR